MPMSPAVRPGARIILAALIAATVTGCGMFRNAEPVREVKEPGIFGPDGLRVAFGGGGDSAAETLGVNTYLWRASLDVIGATGLPLASSDPFGGAITTDWGSLASDPNTQFKITSYVDSPELRASALRVLVNKRVRGGAGWTDAPVNAQTTRQLENAILRRARELRIIELENS